MDRFTLRRRFIGDPIVLEIDQAQVGLLKEAMEDVHVVLAWEDKFHMLVENYIEFEAAVLGVCLGTMLRPHRDHADFQDIRRVLNRRLANYLSLARQYIDQSKRKIQNLLDHTPESVSFARKLSDEYDSKFEYRLAEALRNYVQHCDLGLGTIWVGGAGLIRRRTSDGSITLKFSWTAKASSRTSCLKPRFGRSSVPLRWSQTCWVCCGYTLVP